MMLFYPCIEDHNGRIKVKVSKAMAKEEAEEFLKIHYRSKWFKCEAIPQPIDHPYFTK